MAARDCSRCQIRPRAPHQCPHPCLSDDKSCLQTPSEEVQRRHVLNVPTAVCFYGKSTGCFELQGLGGPLPWPAVCFYHAFTIFSPSWKNSTQWASPAALMRQY